MEWNKEDSIKRMRHLIDVEENVYAFVRYYQNLKNMNEIKAQNMPMQDYLNRITSFYKKSKETFDIHGHIDTNYETEKDPDILRMFYHVTENASIRAFIFFQLNGNVQ